MTKDHLYDRPCDPVAPFRFDDQVAAVFQDMIERSVPGYRFILETLGEVARNVHQDGTLVYDLGCSLGEGALTMALALQGRPATIVGVDNSGVMIARARDRLAAFSAAQKVELLVGDITTLPLKPASLIALNFVQQFVPPDDRQDLITRTSHALTEGGVLFLSEKICADTPQGEGLLVDLHHTFKRRNGYSDLAIAQKRAALEQVLIPDKVADHVRRLKAAGFEGWQIWFQTYNFVSIIAWKGKAPSLEHAKSNA